MLVCTGASWIRLQSLTADSSVRCPDSWSGLLVVVSIRFSGRMNRSAMEQWIAKCTLTSIKDYHTRDWLEDAYANDPRNMERMK